DRGAVAVDQGVFAAERDSGKQELERQSARRRRVEVRQVTEVPASRVLEAVLAVIGVEVGARGRERRLAPAHRVKVNRVRAESELADRAANEQPGVRVGERD